MDIRLTFDQVPEVYDRIRPGYPDELFDHLFARLPEQPRILESGPGTGQATVGLLQRCARVTAVEFGPNLAQALRAKFANEDQLDVITASFEEAPLPHDHFDAVVAATSYHWITPEAQVERPLQVLKPGGYLAVLNLIQVDSTVDRGYFDRVSEIYSRYEVQLSAHQPKTHETAMPPIAHHLDASGRYHAAEITRVPWDQTYSSAQYRDLLWSYSGTQMLKEPERSAMVDELVAVIDDEFDGTLTRPLVATLTLAQRL